MRRRWVFVVCVSALCLGARARAVEIGVDGGLEAVSSGGQTTTHIALPMGLGSYLPSIRFGFEVDPGTQIEPAIGFDFIDGPGSSTTLMRLGVSLVKEIGHDRERARPYVRVGGVVLASDYGDVGGDTQFGLGFGFGSKMPLAPRVGLRPEVSVTRFFETDESAAATDLALRLGLSVFLD